MADGHATSARTFFVSLDPATHVTRAAFTAARPVLWRLTGLDRVERLYEQSAAAPGATFDARALHTLGIDLRATFVDDAVIPATGPLLVVANHPTGALDALVVAEAIRRIRTDVRTVANHLLAAIPELHDTCFFVDPFGGTAAAARSRAGLRAAHLWLRNGGAVILFPAGEVAWMTKSGNVGGARIDSPWSETAARLAAATHAHVLPVFIDGTNSRTFYAAGRIHPRLRTVLLGRELLNKRHTTVRVTVGPPIGPDEIRTLAADAATDLMRRAVEQVSARSVDVGQPAAIAQAVEPALLERDVSALPPAALLLSSGGFDVFCADSVRLPNVLREIGRLREITFRAAGEGTGRTTDLDRFDAHYQQLFVWHRERREIVGAYRIGFTDRIAASIGIEGLYTRTLFRYETDLLDRLGPALELGRSFVRAEYQRSHSALLLLWKGIGHLVARAPRYRTLFGCVSISSRYSRAAQQLLRGYLTDECLDESLGGLVSPVTPPEALLACESRPGSLRELDRLMADLEGGTGIPILLRQYLRLNATVLGFNVDPAFNDTLDALMMVDLDRLPRAAAERYLGSSSS